MGEVLRLYRAEPLPSILDVPVRDFSHCLELPRRYFNRTNLAEDLDPEAERHPFRTLLKTATLSHRRSPFALRVRPAGA